MNVKKRSANGESVKYERSIILRNRKQNTDKADS